VPSFVSSLLSESVSALSLSRWRASAVLRSSSVSVASGSVAYLDDERAIESGWRWRVGKSAQNERPKSVQCRCGRLSGSCDQCPAPRESCHVWHSTIRASTLGFGFGTAAIYRANSEERRSATARVLPIPSSSPFGCLFVVTQAGTSLDFQQTRHECDAQVVRGIRMIDDEMGGWHVRVHHFRLR